MEQGQDENEILGASSLETEKVAQSETLFYLRVQSWVNNVNNKYPDLYSNKFLLQTADSYPGSPADKDKRSEGMIILNTIVYSLSY